jgi:hypothetical protein
MIACAFLQPVFACTVICAHGGCCYGSFSSIISGAFCTLVSYSSVLHTQSPVLLISSLVFDLESSIQHCTADCYTMHQHRCCHMCSSGAVAVSNPQQLAYCCCRVVLASLLHSANLLHGRLLVVTRTHSAGHPMLLSEWLRGHCCLRIFYGHCI